MVFSDKDRGNIFQRLLRSILAEHTIKKVASVKGPRKTERKGPTNKIENG